MLSEAEVFFNTTKEAKQVLFELSDFCPLIRLVGSKAFFYLRVFKQEINSRKISNQIQDNICDIKIMSSQSQPFKTRSTVKQHSESMPSSKNNSQDIGTFLVQIVQITVDVLLLTLQILLEIITSSVRLFVGKRPKSVKNEIVLITGAGHGMGKELAFLYAAEGATVVAWDINEETGNQVVKEIAERGYPKAHFFLCDVSRRENVLNVAKQVQKKVGEVTILFNNAGIMPTHSFLEQTEAEIERTMNINVMAHYWTLEAFLPTMIKNNYGHIVALSSTAGLFGISNLVPYCCSKYAVRGLMAALYHECRTDKKNEIKLTSIYPYMVDTGLCKNPKIRFENIMPLVTAKAAAKAIMRGQRTDLKEVTIPGYYYYLRVILSLLPAKCEDLIFDFLSVGLHSDLV